MQSNVVCIISGIHSDWPSFRWHEVGTNQRRQHRLAVITRVRVSRADGRCVDSGADGGRAGTPANQHPAVSRPAQ